jgi:hypothetical protein
MAMKLKLPADIEAMLAVRSEHRRKLWLAEFERLSLAERRAKIKAMRKFVAQYSELPDDLDDPPTEAERQQDEQCIRAIHAHRARLN